MLSQSKQITALTQLKSRDNASDHSDSQPDITAQANINGSDARPSNDLVMTPAPLAIQKDAIISPTKQATYGDAPISTAGGLHNREGGKVNAPKETSDRNQKANAAPCQTSYKDAVAGAVPAANTTHAKHGKTKTIPWRKVTSNTPLTRLPYHRKWPSRKHSKPWLQFLDARQKKQVDYSDIFLRVRRAPYKTVYRTLNTSIDHRHLLGVSFIGANIAEILIDSGAETANFRKMRFMEWKHLPNLEPTRHDATNSSPRREPRERIKAAYTR